MATRSSISSSVKARGWRVRTLSAPFERVPRHDGHGQDRLVLVLRQVRELLEACVEVRLRGDHHRSALGRGNPRDPLARAHPRRASQLLDARAERRAQHELVRALVVEVDEARVGAERVGDLARDELEHLLQVERRVDGCNRLGEQPQVTRGGIHGCHCHRITRRVSFDDWLLALHVLSAFALVAGIVFFWVMIVAVRGTDTPEGTIRMAPAREGRERSRGDWRRRNDRLRDLARLLRRWIRHLGRLDHRRDRPLGPRDRAGRSDREGVHGRDEEGRGAPGGGTDWTKRGAPRDQSHAARRRHARHWRASFVLLILIDMIWKPGA